jgi:hypothetical protein
MLFSLSFCYGQRDLLLLKNGIEKPNSVSAHHFGLFHLRINQNFQETAVKRTTFQLVHESANSFQPLVEAFITDDPVQREQLSQLIWHERGFSYVDPQTTPGDYMNIEVDAVFKVFRLDLQTPLTEKSELGITLRTFIPTEGHYPFSLFTSDESIEWFHSNIAGGEDAFGRRFFGLNQMNVSYLDRNGRTLNLKKNRIIFSGIELNHFYYPKLFEEEKNIYTNFGSHLGINTTSENPSLDIGISANLIKKWTLKNENEFRFGIGISGMRKRAIEYGTPIEFGNNLWMGSGEVNWEFTKYTQKGNAHSFSLNYQLQTRYNKKQEANYYQLRSIDWQSVNAGWHNGFSTLYETLTIYTLFYTYHRKNFNLSLYIKEDLKVNNAPDLQTGISIKIPITKL